MNDLLEKKCVPCEGGIKAFDISEIHKYQKKVDGWEIVQNDKNLLSSNIACTVLKTQEKKTQKGTSYAIIKFSDLNSVF